jgi:CRISPR-associated endonuclease/helicase Cas3
MLAHSLNCNGRGHDLVAHLEAVAAEAQRLAGKFGAEDLAYLAGLWHDLGKFSDSFQTYIRDPQHDRRRGLERDHATTGALHSAKSLSGAAASLIPWVIAGHHSGLADQGDLQERLRHPTHQSRTDGILAIATCHLAQLDSKVTPKLPGFITSSRSTHTIEFFVRMLYSVLTDADFLDTERHFNPENSAIRGDYPTLIDLLPRLENRVAELARNPSGTNHPVHRVRQEVYQDCVRVAASPPGVFRLIVPTGGGKTLSSMAFALQHAIQHGLDRIIVAIPYTSIIEQTADQYIGIFGERAVLEHHSGVDVDDPKEDLSPAHVQARLASQNWDSPIVVTTTVQLFDSIFANRSSRMRKLHNLAHSVIVLDEVQTLPQS